MQLSLLTGHGCGPAPGSPARFPPRTVVRAWDAALWAPWPPASCQADSLAPLQSPAFVFMNICWLLSSWLKHCICKLKRGGFFLLLELWHHFINQLPGNSSFWKGPKPQWCFKPTCVSLLVAVPSDGYDNVTVIFHVKTVCVDNGTLCLNEYFNIFIVHLLAI